MNTNVITGLGMCKVCTEAVNVQKIEEKNAPKTQNTASQKGTKPRKGCVSGSANVPDDPCFDWKRPCFGGLNQKNRGQTSSLKRHVGIH